MTIIRTQNEIADASTAVLVATYNALTGKSIKKFSSRGAGESQVANAIMAAQDRAGHLGVPKGAAPVAITVAEESAKNDAGATQAPAAVSPPKSLRAKLALAAGDASPHKSKPKAERAERKSGTLVAVVPTGRGTSKLQAASDRAAVFNYIVSMHAKTGAPVTIAALDKHFDRDTRGFVGKLLEKSHLEAAE
jgi:hypothetical protein